MAEPKLNLKHLNFQALLTAEGLSTLDQFFITYLTRENPTLAMQLQDYRTGKLASGITPSEWIMASAAVLETFIATLFDIEAAVVSLRQATRSHDPIFQFKDY